VVTVLAAFLALPAISGAATYSLKWSKSVPLLNANDGGGFDSVACAPTVAATKALFCIAGDVRGDIFETVHPAQAASQWHRRYIDPKTAITGISCPSAQLCVAVDGAGRVLHSTDPIGGTAAWSKPVSVDTATLAGGGTAGLAAIDCPTTTFCLAVDNAANGQVAYTTNPTGPASAWTLTTVGSGVLLDSVSCASTTLCVIGGTNAYFATDPTGGATGWKATAALSSGSSVIASLACNTTKLCLGVGYGDSGVGLSVGSSAPTTTEIADSVACPERNFCVAVDGASNAYTSSAPVRGDWSLARPLKKNSQSTVSQVACNSAICVEVDNRGTVTYGAVKGATSTTTTPTKTTTSTTTTSTTKTTATSTTPSKTTTTSATTN
jgi:hypothetical protein